MSGGVDSSVSAAMLLEAGYRPIGVTLAMGRKCDQLAIEDARKVAAHLAIEHRVLDVSRDFEEKVVRYFVDSYSRGKTPNPCGMCNRFVKFESLIGLMRDMGAANVATGHYATIAEKDGVYELRRAIDRNKDQSYFLSTINYDFLQYIKFPLNSLTKTEVRKYARKIGLHVADKSESQDVCFVETNYRDFLEQKLGTSERENKNGSIEHVNGDILGTHVGIFNYTIGQRRGLGLSSGEPLFVVAMDEKTNTVYVGSDKDLYSNILKINGLNIFSELEEGREYGIKLRSSSREQRGTVKFLEEDAAVQINLTQPTRAITRGQLCCLYEDDRVMASGWIE
ncbi:MAG: tRNA 2-thiouridine(34) synthase MnmA [Rickettsiales bacterium]|nr:tRNA 2-thiouridine(34) synthase MnmA [Rickettsiales bacterium]